MLQKIFIDVDETIENIFKIDDSWIASSIKGANKLWHKFSHLKSKGIGHFIEDLLKLSILRKLFLLESRKQKLVSIDINKWSPADIYITGSSKGINISVLMKKMTTSKD